GDQPRPAGRSALAGLATGRKPPARPEGAARIPHRPRLHQERMTSRLLLQLHNLACGYKGQKIVQDLNLHLNSGDIGCLLGPSGCGKTTTLRAIAGFEPISQGEIRLAGDVISRAGFTLAPEARRIGMVFQDYALFPHLTVAEKDRKSTRLNSSHVKISYAGF